MTKDTANVQTILQNILNAYALDFILQLDNEIIAIEVKSDGNVTGKSLTLYRKEFDPKLCIRYSLKNLKQDGGLINIPLFMADMTDLIIKLAIP